MASLSCTCVNLPAQGLCQNVGVAAGLASGMLGMSAGDERSVPVTFPPTWVPEQLRGIQATCSVNVSEIFEWELPEVLCSAGSAAVFLHPNALELSLILRTSRAQNSVADPFQLHACRQHASDVKCITDCTFDDSRSACPWAQLTDEFIKENLKSCNDVAGARQELLEAQQLQSAEVRATNLTSC